MIRPITVICWLLALSSGLYLYHSKHQVELIDQQIDQIAKQTADLRVESRGLLDEWIRLGEPEQLHKYSDQYLGLQPITPTQFARMSDLASRLPPPEPDAPEANVVAQSSDGTAGTEASASTDQADDARPSAIEPAAAPDEADAAGTDDLPVPPIPPATIPVAASVPAVAPLPLQARPVTPRLPDGQAGPESSHAQAAVPERAEDEPRSAATRLTPITPAEAHLAPPGPINHQEPGQPAGQEPLQAREPHEAPGLPPLQAQGRNVAGLPPLQAQGSMRELAQGPGRLASTAARPETHAYVAPHDARPAEAPPLPRQTMEPRAAGAPVTAPPPGGSLLGMSRGSVPLPLPAPTPVNANWSSPGGGGPPGPGR